MLRTILLFVCLPAILVGAKKCTNPANNTTPPVEPESTTPYIEPTTMDIPAPTTWPSGKFALLRAGKTCPQGFGFRTGWRYQDSEDYLNGNSWPKNSTGLPGKMKHDGYTFFYCIKNKGTGDYGWPEGNYCIARFSKRCPARFQTGSITWDDENDSNTNSRKGSLPSGTYDEDVTTMNFCCRDDGSASTGISLPVTRPFYLYRYTEECQKVRKMDVTEEVIQFDDEDTGNKNNKTGAHPMNSGNPSNHRLHFCLYQPRT